MYYFRDQQGLEVDFLLPKGSGDLWMIECKAAKTVQPAMAGPLLSLRRAMSRPPAKLLVVHHSPETAPPMHALAPGVGAMDLNGLVNLMSAPVARRPRPSRTPPIVG